MTQAEMREKLLELAGLFGADGTKISRERSEFFRQVAKKIKEDWVSVPEKETVSVCKAMIRFWQKRLEILDARPKEKE